MNSVIYIAYSTTVWDIGCVDYAKGQRDRKWFYSPNASTTR